LVKKDGRLLLLAGGRLISRDVFDFFLGLIADDKTILSTPKISVLKDCTFRTASRSLPIHR